MFYHGWNAYYGHAFPADELRPLTCDGLTRDFDDPTNIGRNDVLGNYSLTLIDSLDMFAILGDQPAFERYIGVVRDTVFFNVSSTVQVFETTIRGIGGLLSAHLYAAVPKLGSSIPGYDGHLLALAYDLGKRLLPAFDTPNGIPAPRVNLETGIMLDDQIQQITETCTSGAGSLLLEFGMLSRLTGDKRFEKVARKAFFALYMRRSDLDLVAMSVDSRSGLWQAPLTGNGASIDSFYEYALKYAILFNDNDFMAVFNNLYHALKAHSFNGWAFRNIHYDRAHLLTSWIDSLASFFTSLMVLAGDIENAIQNHIMYLKIWLSYAGLPERWNFLLRNHKYSADSADSVVLEWYPLRPEFIESNWYLYQATKDPLFLEIGVLTMQDIQMYNRVPCGFAGTQDVRTGELSNRMESFFLSETVKYLYLLFNKDHMLNREFSNYVFSTEAHPLWYDDDIMEYAGSDRFDQLEKVSGFDDHNKDEYEKDISNDIPGQTKFEAIVQFTNPVRLISRTLVKLIDRIIQSFEDLILPVQMVEYMDDSNSHTECHRKFVLQETATSSVPSASVHAPRYYYDEQCEVVNMRWLGDQSPYSQFYSAVASWESLYQLDAIYSFRKPTHLEHQARGLEMRPFYNRYVNPESTCKTLMRSSTGMRILDDTTLDIMISIPKGGRRGKVLWRHYSGEVETSSLNGMRIKLHKHQNRTLEEPSHDHGHNKNNDRNSGMDTYAGETYRVTMVNGIRVPDTLWVHELTSSYSRDLNMEVVQDQVYVDGIVVENLRITGRRDKRKS